MKNSTSKNIYQNPKNKFVLDILDYALKKKIDTPIRDRLLKLVSNEVTKTGIIEETILERLTNLELEFGRIKNSNDPIKAPERVKERVKKHSPKAMVKFLYHFTIDEKFKWFTHNPEGSITDFNYTNYTYAAKIEYDKVSGWNINRRTYFNVKNFIFDEKEESFVFGKGKIDCSWRDVKTWCLNNLNAHPFEAEINGNIFKKYINQFKKVIEFRTDEPDSTFNIHVKNFIRKELGVDFNLSFSNSFILLGQSMKLYCDVNQFFYGLKNICEWIKINKSKSNDVEIDLEQSEEFYTLEIFHKMSYLAISPQHEKLKGLSGDFDTIRKLLFSVADWEIEASFQYDDSIENYKIICLDERVELISNKLNTPNKLERLKQNINGVKHLIKMYKTENL